MPSFGARFVDLHFHAGVDLYRRRHSTLAAGRRYAAHEGWVVIKSHLGSTAAQAWEARQEGLPVSGSVCLNAIAGGLDSRVMEQAVYQHGDDGPARLVVYLPTLVDAGSSTLKRQAFHSRMDVAGLGRIRVSDGAGQLQPIVKDILRAARDLPVVIATGHADRDEIRAIVDASLAVGLDRLLITHASHPMGGLTAHDLVELSELPHVYLELTALSRLLGHLDEPHFADLIRSTGRVVYSSDLGQPDQPDIDEWLDISARWFRDAGLRPDEAAAVTLRNPSELLAL